MVFSIRDMTALQLLYWCQYVRPENFYRVVPETELLNLMCLGLVKRHRNSGAYALTANGLRFMQVHFPAAMPSLTQSYHKGALARRLRVSDFVLTAYRAGIHIFTTSMEELSGSPSLFLSAITRSRGSNPWGSTRVAAIAHLSDLVCAVHYVCPGIGKLALTDELTAFNNQTVPLRALRRGFIFAGENYGSILEELEAPQMTRGQKLASYGEAYRCLSLPVFLLPCDDVGALQLRLMSVPDYRKRMTMAALKAQYHPPPADRPDLDAIFQGMPFVMAADMDLRRVDSALQIAQNQGRPQIAVAALEGQADLVLFSRYRDFGLTRVFTLTDESLTAVLGAAPHLHMPARTQYLTEEGDVIDAPPIQANRKTGKPR